MFWATLQVKFFLWKPFGNHLQGWTEDFVIEGTERYSIQWHYGHNSVHEDGEQGTFLERFTCMLLREDFWDWSSLRCNLVHSGRSNLANAWIPFWTCNSEIFNKPQKAGGGGTGLTPKSALIIHVEQHVSVLGSLRYGDYGLRLRLNMLLRMIKTTWLFIFSA